MGMIVDMNGFVNIPYFNEFKRSASKTGIAWYFRAMIY